MCKCNKNNRCRCNHNPCGCEKIDAKCVLYNGVCLSTLGICADTDLEEIVIIIDGLIQDIFEQIEQAWTAANIGGGAEVYKGISSLGIHMFRTLIDSVSVNVVENENNISLEVDEDWLEGVIRRIVNEIISNIPDTELDSPFNSISVTSSSTNEFDIDINPNTFTSPNGSVTITSNTLSGELRINLQVDPNYINSLLPTITNVGSGTADIYKGLNGNTHEFRRITTQVTQPSTTDNQITGTVGASATVVGDNVQINLDFSNLKVPVQQVGIPEYYVNSAGNDTTADGSIVRPYQTWDACKAAIIDAANGGTFYNPTNYNVRVIFQSNITSNQSLTVNGVTFHFENNSVFTYTGSESAVYNMQEIISAIPTAGDGTKTRGGYCGFSGFGVITASESNTTPYVILKAGGFGVPGIEDYQHGFQVRFLSGVIELREKPTAMSNFTLATDDYGNPLKNGAQRDVYVLNKTGGNDVIPAVEGIISVSGRNYPVRDCLYVNEGAQLLIRPRINRAIYTDNEAGFINYGSIVIEPDIGTTTVRYGEDLKVTNPGNPLIGQPGQYTPSTSVSLISVRGGSGFITSSNGILNSFLLGSSNQGGYNSFVEIQGNKTQFRHESPESMSVDDKAKYNHLVYFLNTPSGTGNNQHFYVENIYTRIRPYGAVISAASGVNGTNISFTINNGSLENYIDLTSNKLFSNNTLKTNINITSTLLTIGGYLYKSLNAVPNRDDNAHAIATGLLPGMIYRTKDKDETSSFLKIVH